MCHKIMEILFYGTLSITTRGISTDRIRKYGFALKGKEVLIGI